MPKGLCHRKKNFQKEIDRQKYSTISGDSYVIYLFEESTIAIYHLDKWLILKTKEKKFKFYFLPMYLNISSKSIYIKLYKALSKGNDHDFLWLIWEITNDWWHLPKG